MRSSRAEHTSLSPCGAATDALLPCAACYPTPSHRYRGPPLLTKKWMLSRVVGECSSDELPAHPSPSFPPEAVVEAQLHSLR